MKRGLLLLLMLLIVPFVSASIYTDSTLKTQYNLGDSIQLSGYLVEDADTKGILSILLSCGNETQQLAAKSINIKAQESATFSYNLPVTGILIGNCRFLLSLNDFSSNPIEQYETSGFDISKELIGNFDINAKEFQLGDKLVIAGGLKNLNNEEVNGLSILYIKKEGTNYLVDSKDIIGGVFSYETILTSIPAGAYTIDVKVSDAKGNEKLFENILGLTLYDELVIAAKAGKSTYLPGEALALGGSVHKKTGPSVSDVKIEILFENQSYTSDVKEGQFSFNSVLDKKIKSYYHNITFNVEDSNGNFGSSVINFEITPVPTSLEAELDKSGYVPEDSINILINLYDQAHDILSRSLKLKITNVYGDAVYEDTKLTTDPVSYKLPQFANPGEWKLDLESENLKLAKKIVVEKMELLNVDLVGQTLIIKNMGNELYDNKVDIDSDGVIKSEGIRLKPDEQTSIELYNLFDDGTHAINVLGKTFTASIVDPRNVLEKGLDGLGYVTGYYAVNKYGKIPGTAYIIGLGIVFVILLTIIIQLIMKFNNKGKPDHIRRKSEQPSIISRKASELVQKKKYDFNFGRADEKDIVDFRKRMSEKINSERRNTFMLPNERKKDDDNKGPFSMFN